MMAVRYVLRALGAVLLTLGMCSVVCAQEGSVLDQKIATEGEVRVASGEILYTFHKDGSFKAEPLVISGRSVHGTWSWSAKRKGWMEVRGEWGWINGLSREGDVRWMEVFVEPLPKKMRAVGYAKIQAYRAKVRETKPVSLVVVGPDGVEKVLKRPAK